MAKAAAPIETKIGSRDLREIVRETLHITIEGIGDFTDQQWIHLALAQRIAVAACRIQKASQIPHVGDAGNAPWEIVSFDRVKRQLVVKPV